MTSWTELTAELTAWHDAGLRASLWWRDDDAVEVTPALERLLDLAQSHRVPLTIAVVPAHATADLARRLTQASSFAVPVQHGFAHENHAPGESRKWELGQHRDRAEVVAELDRGRERMDECFGTGWLPVMVPPWNRIAPGIVTALEGLGYCGLSTLGARKQVFAAPGIMQVNTHVDIMRWGAPRGFLGVEAALDLLCAHLSDRRLGQVDSTEPSGILTHHLAHDPACWAFLEDLLDRLCVHSAVEFINPRTIFTACQEGASAATGMT